MLVLDVGVEADGTGPKIERHQLAELGQLVEGLVDGLQRDRLHLGADGLVDRFGRRVGDVALKGPEDALALCGDLATADPEQVGELLGRLHRSQDISNRCFFTIVVEITRSSLGGTGSDRPRPRTVRNGSPRSNLGHGALRRRNDVPLVVVVTTKPGATSTGLL